MQNGKLTGKVALITGAAQRVGAATAKTLHHHGCNIVIHYRRSERAAKSLQEELQAQRKHSVRLVRGDILDPLDRSELLDKAAGFWQRLDVLVNNASSFYPTPIGSVTYEQWDDLIGSNLKAPFFLCQQAAPWLIKSMGCIVNIVDIHAERPLKSYPVYSIAKAGLAMLTKALARELGPDVRVNGVAPGAILWPSRDIDDERRETIIERTALKRKGEPQDIANAVVYLTQAQYVTGQIIAVDGGRSLHL